MLFRLANADANGLIAKSGGGKLLNLNILIRFLYESRKRGVPPEPLELDPSFFVFEAAPYHSHPKEIFFENWRQSYTYRRKLLCETNTAKQRFVRDAFHATGALACVQRAISLTY